MAYTQNTNCGSLFANEKRNDRQPDLKGTINIEGKTYNLAAWLKTSQSGKQYYSLKLDEYQQNTASPAPAFIGTPATASATTTTPKRDALADAIHAKAETFVKGIEDEAKDDLPF